LSLRSPLRALLRQEDRKRSVVVPLSSSSCYFCLLSVSFRLFLPALSRRAPLPFPLTLSLPLSLSLPPSLSLSLFSLPLSLSLNSSFPPTWPCPGGACRRRRGAASPCRARQRPCGCFRVSNFFFLGGGEEGSEKKERKPERTRFRLSFSLSPSLSLSPLFYRNVASCLSVSRASWSSPGSDACSRSASLVATLNSRSSPSHASSANAAFWSSEQACSSASLISVLFFSEFLLEGFLVFSCFIVFLRGGEKRGIGMERGGKKKEVRGFS
jgi:hypothetical protein